MRRKKKDSTRKFLNRFVAFLLPEEVDDCLKLRALMQNTGRSTLVRGIVMAHAKKSEWNRQELVDKYAAFIYANWQYRGEEGVGYDEFISDLQSDLRSKKKFSKELTDLIVEACEREHKQRQSTAK